MKDKMDCVTLFYGDGDSKAYPAIKDIYGPSKPFKKFECVGHYQKRVSSGFVIWKKSKRTGRERKTHYTKIDKMQNYFGTAFHACYEISTL